MSWLDRQIHWRRSDDVFAPWETTYGGHTLRLRLGDFPAEMLYTLVVDDCEVLCLDSPWPDGWYETVVLRQEENGEDCRSLWAYLESNGDFIIDGQDLGPSVERVFGEGKREYEWKRTVPAREVPKLRQVLGADQGTLASRPRGLEILDALQAWLGAHEAGELEQLIEELGFTRVFWSRLGD